MDRNPQREQMADESMVRNLAAQAEAIWPQEEKLFERYGLTGPLSIVDVGCGTGEITSRLAAKYPAARLLGVDILDSSIAIARRHHAGLAPRLEFRQGDAFALDIPSDSADLIVCRHMTQSVPHVEQIVTELKRVARPAGWLHVLSEDYGMLHMPVEPLDTDDLWHRGAIAFASRTGTDARVGRRTWNLLQEAGFEDLRVDYIIVDTLRVPRDTFARIMEAWRDGYTEALASAGLVTVEKIAALFDQVIADIRDPTKYSVWHVPIVSGRKPAR
jgi:ubiquinone/menaquinone biosynthesis C-methylase UbiE